MNTFRNAPELWAHTRPAAAETQPADLDDPVEVRRTLRNADADYEQELEELDRAAVRMDRLILGMAVLVIAAMVAAHLWPGLARWLP